ncbi:response regulator transcription factor [Nocardioides sp. T5]|uniref:response regulator transcription factor n=1 Tax=Nocardioides sp. T5 TaxID=3400182 RepID=UPI003A8A63F2
MRTVIAEDQVLLRDGLARLLRSAGHDVVAEVGDGRSLVSETVRLRPDLVVADIRMPPSYADEGSRAVVLLRERFPDLAVMLLSQAVDPLVVSRATRGRSAGFGYLLKDRVLDSDTFVRQLAEIAAGATVIDPGVLPDAMRGSDRLRSLTNREVEVLGLVATGRSNPGIAADLVISRRTVDAHLRSIFTKLGIEADPDGNQRVLATLNWLGGAVQKNEEAPGR